jgi:hypothetical protein
MKTKQEIFDIVVAHARQQKQHSGTSKMIGCTEYMDQCLYRLGNLKCFIGALISDETYTPEIERLSIPYVFNDIELQHNSRVRLFKQILLINEIDVNNYDMRDFLKQLQNIHDTNPVSKWETQFNVFALSFDLVYVAPVTQQQ